MRQLWLNGTRMDSIPLLRQYFIHAEHHLRPSLCEQILEQCSSGALVDWLSRQPELHAVVTQMEALGTIPLSDLLATLHRNHQPSPAQLAFLCDVPEAWFRSLLESRDSSESASEKQRRLMSYPWWNDMAPRLMTVSDWSNVVTDRKELYAVLRKHRQQLSQCSPTETIYLCNTGELFVWDLRDGDAGLRFVGCGQPTLWLDPRRFIPQIDLNRRNLWLEGLDFKLPSATSVTGDDDHLKHVTLSR